MHADGTLSISVNGGHRRVADGLTLAGLAAELGIEPDHAVVERNLEPVPRAMLAQVRVEDGDEIEIAASVGN